MLTNSPLPGKDLVTAPVSESEKHREEQVEIYIPQAVNQLLSEKHSKMTQQDDPEWPTTWLAN